MDTATKQSYSRCLSPHNPCFPCYHRSSIYDLNTPYLPFPSTVYTTTTTTTTTREISGLSRPTLRNNKTAGVVLINRWRVGYGRPVCLKVGWAWGIVYRP